MTNSKDGSSVGLKRPHARICKSPSSNPTDKSCFPAGVEEAKKDASNSQSSTSSSQHIAGCSLLSKNEPNLNETSHFDESVTKKRLYSVSMSRNEIVKHYNSIQDRGKMVRNQSQTFYIRQYNNWVKSIMIQQASSCFANKKHLSVLDLCCGKGGDLKKWEKARPTLYLGIDIASSSISDARNRLRSMRTRLNAHFDVADCFHSPVYIRSDGIGVSEVECTDCFQFDIVSCMFSFHYAFESVESVRIALENVSRHLKPDGGIFIITIPKASTIEQLKFRAFKKTVPPFTAGNSLYEVEFERSPEEEKQLKPEPESDSPEKFAALKYYFSLKDAVNRCPEFSVPMETLFPLAASFGLVCESEMDFIRFYNDYKDHPIYRMLLDRFGLLDGNELNLSPEELDVIGKNWL